MSDRSTACRVCGCTEAQACPGGCCWVPDPEDLGPLCSACLGPVIVAATQLRGRVRNALAMLDGHTCHAGHTDADHLRLHRQVVTEIRAVLELGA